MMSDWFMKEAAPFSESLWEQIDKMVKEAARQHLVGRRFIHLAGPLGAGALAVPVSHLAGGDMARIGAHELVPFTTLLEDFIIGWEDVTTAEQVGLPVELAPAAQATKKLAQREDELIFAGLRGAKGTHKVSLEGWAENGGAFRVVAAAIEKLTGAGIYGPYVMVLSTSLYAAVQRVMLETGRLEVDLIRDLLGGKVYFSPALPAGEGFVLANAPRHLDLAVAQDVTVAYLGNEELDHHLRLLEKIALRVKNPQAICVVK